MRIFLKIIATIVFFMIWGQLQAGCQHGARASGSAIGYSLMNIFGLILLIAGTVGIWKYSPSSGNDHDKDKDNDNDNFKLDKS